MKIITNNDNQSCIELIMKYCSKLSDIIGYPYYFNWSTATNHRDNTPDGELSDICYAMIRCGVYPQHSSVSRFSPVEKQILFGPVNLIIHNHTPLNILTSDIKINTWEDVESNIHVIKGSIDRYLRDLVIQETNRGIIAYNDEYNDNISLVEPNDVEKGIKV